MIYFSECKTINVGSHKGGMCCVFPFQDCRPDFKQSNDGKCVERTACMPNGAAKGRVNVHWCSTQPIFYGVVVEFANGTKSYDGNDSYGICEDSCPKSDPMHD